jgi:hypothetical protein
MLSFFHLKAMVFIFLLNITNYWYNYPVQGNIIIDGIENRIRLLFTLIKDNKSVFPIEN